MPLPLIPLAISGISALAGMFGNRAKKLESESSSTSSFNRSGTSMPTYDEKTRQMRDQLMHAYLDPLGYDPDLSGYQAEGVGEINRGSDLMDRSIENMLASRGLSGTSAGATSRIMNYLNRGNQLSSFINSIPMLAEDRRRQNLQMAGQFFSQLPYGQTTTERGTQTGTQKGTQTQPGNMLGGGLMGLGTSLVGLYGEGAFGKPGGNTSSAPNWQTYNPPQINYDMYRPGQRLF